jgi:hypothetical protein
MPRDEARSFIDVLENGELADLMDAASAAGVATGTGGNVLYESAAARLRAAAANFPHPLSQQELLERQGITPAMQSRSLSQAQARMRWSTKEEIFKSEFAIDDDRHPFNAPEAKAEREALHEARCAAARKGAATRRARRGGKR